MDARVCGGPSAIAKDAARDVARKEAGVKSRTECLPGNGRLVLCKAAEGIVPDWEDGGGLWGKTCGPSKAIRRSGKAGGTWAVLVEGTIDERLARWLGKTTRGRMEKLHCWGSVGPMKGRFTCSEPLCVWRGSRANAEFRGWYVQKRNRCVVRTWEGLRRAR